MLLLRGEMVPVMDVAPALGLALPDGGAAGHPGVGMGEARIGVAAEAVHEVLDVPADSIRPAPHTGGDRDAYVLGVARLEHWTGEPDRPRGDPPRAHHPGQRDQP